VLTPEFLYETQAVMYVVSVPNRNSPPAILLRVSYREDGKVKNRTLANLSGWPGEQVEALRQVLKGNARIDVPLPNAFEIVRTRPHGHVAAALGVLQQTGLDRLLAPKPEYNRQLVIAMVISRLISPLSKLATARALSPETLDSTLGEMLGVEAANQDALYEAMDWLLERQPAIEDALARRHLPDGVLVLYDVSSTYFEGRTCSLAKYGHSRDGKHDKLQIVFGLLTTAEGCPVAIEVFEGNTGDPTTLSSQVKKLKERFGLKRIVLVGDRGMITDARIREDLTGIEGLDWITALRAPAIQNLLESKALQLSLFDKKDLAEISSPDFPKERLIACKNPLLAEERKRKRNELLDATQRELEKVRAATQRAKRPLKGKEKIGLRVGKVLGRFKMGKHFQLQIDENTFHYERDRQGIATEAALDGIYVIRTTLEPSRLGAEETVRCYKQLASVERAFRSMKTVDLEIRPIHHRKAERVKAHVFLCLLAYYVEWHMRSALKPLLFDDEDKTAAAAARKSIVAPAQRSERARAKALTKRTENNAPVHSFRTLLRDLATIAKNRVQPKAVGAKAFDMLTKPTPHQQQMLAALNVQLRA
jgi:transposase